MGKLFEEGSSQMITVDYIGRGVKKTKKNDNVIFGQPLMMTTCQLGEGNHIDLSTLSVHRTHAGHNTRHFA